MVHIRIVLTATILLMTSLGAAGVVQAAEITPMEKAELSQLTPQLRSKVEARLVSGQTVHGVLEAMLLNDVSQDFASGQVVATDFQRGDIVVQNTAGQVKVFPFDVATLTIKH
jgi:multidrug efflux pump subunit AcrA (membrane-fusion protein)